MTESVYVRIDCRPGPQQSVSPEQIDQLSILFPDLVQSGADGKEIILINAEGADQRVKLLLDQAQQSGINIWGNAHSGSGFVVRIHRGYLPKELDDCRYFSSCDAGSAYLGDKDYPLVCDSHGIPVLRGKPRQKTRMFGMPEIVQSTFFVARGEAKKLLESAGFKGLRFYPVEFNRVRHLEPEDLLWAVWSDLVLPPVKNLFRIAGEVGLAEKLNPSTSGMSPVNGVLSQPELHYRREDLDEFGDFDVALMREPKIIQGAVTREVIFSQRFRRFVIDELGVPFSGVPVRLDDDHLIPWEGPYPSPWAHLNQRPAWLEALQEKVSRKG